MMLNELYKLYGLNPHTVAIRKARKFFEGEVTMTGERVDRLWVKKDLKEQLHDIQLKLDDEGITHITSLDVIRDLLVTKREVFKYE